MRALIRLAWKDSWRRRGRTLLAVALVALPVAILVVASMVVHTAVPSAAAKRANDRGQADAVILEVPQALRDAFTDPGPDGMESFFAEDVLPGYQGSSATLPPPLRAVTVHTLHAVYPPGGSLRVTDVPIADPVTRGMVTLRSGRAPRPGEVALSPRAREMLGVAKNGRIQLAVPGVTLDAAVSGVVVNPEKLDEAIVVTGSQLTSEQSSETKQLIDDGGRPDIRNAELGRLMTLDRFTFASDQNRDRAGVLAAGVLVMVVMSIVIAAAFAIGAHRQLRSIGLMTVAGASPSHIRRLLLLEGTVAGVLGAVAGTLVGAVGMLVLAPHLDRISNRLITGPRVSGVDFAVIALLAIATATAAALGPARAAARLSPLAALAERRPLPRVARWLGLAGVTGLGIGSAAVAVGAALSPVRNEAIVIGAALALAGGIACAPAAVGLLEAVGRRTRGTTRMVVRSIARQRGRTGALVAAIMAVGALAIAATTVWNSYDTLHNNRFDAVLTPPDQIAFQMYRLQSAPTAINAAQIEDLHQDEPPAVPDDALARLADAFDAVHGSYRSPSGGTVSDIGPLRARSGTVYGSMRFAVGDAAALDALGGKRAAAAFADGKAVAFASGRIFNGTVELNTQSSDGGPGRSVTLPAVLIPRPTSWALPSVLVSEATAAEHHLLDGGSTPGSVLRLREPLTRDDEHALRRLTSELNAEFAADKDTPVALTIAYGSGSRNDSSRALALLLALAALLALGVIGIGLTLVAVDSRDEIAVLIAVGASPRTRRGWFGLQAAFLAMLGGLLAVPLGFLPAIAFLSGSDAGYPLLFPLPQAAALVVGVPIVAGLGAYLLSWRSRRWAMPAID